MVTMSRNPPAFLGQHRLHARLDQTDQTWRLVVGLVKTKRARYAILLSIIVLAGYVLLPTAIRSPAMAESPLDMDDTDWSRFAYSQYVANDTAYLCNAVMMFEALDRLHSKPDRVLMYPRGWNAEDGTSINSRLLTKAQEQYKVKLVPIQVQSVQVDPEESERTSRSCSGGD